MLSQHPINAFSTCRVITAYINNQNRKVLLNVIVFALLFIWGIAPGVAHAQYQNSVSGDRQALEELYRATGGSQWTNNAGWLQGNPSDSWHGVEVNASGRVVRVDLSENNLRGSDGLPASIGNLKQMRYLNVMHNQVSGALPEALFSQCRSLVYLYLNFSDAYWNGSDDPHIAIQSGGGDLHTGKTDRGAKNKFTGQVPSSTNLPNLEWFLLSWTEISDIDADAIFSNSHSLKGFLVANNINLAGKEIPIPASIGNATGITHFAVDQDNASGADDGWGGELPDEFSNLVSMEHMRLGGNAFTGALPDLSGWTKIYTFGISSCEFTSGFPAYLLDGSVTDRMNSFGTASNNFNDAQLPATIDGSVKTVYVFNSGLTGSLTESHFPDQLTVTDFSYNDFSGDGPSDLRNLKRIRNLRWRDANLGGQWPDLDWTNQQGNTGSGGTLKNPVRHLSRVWFDNNRYVFADMLVVSDQGKTLFEWYKQEADRQFRYAPQKPFGSKSDDISGSTIDFSDDVTHPENRYQWYRNGQQISGATSSVIDAGAHGDGTYRLEVTNPNVPGLTLQSIEINMPEDGNSGDTTDSEISDGDSTIPPAPPLLSSPQDGATIESSSVALDWNTSSGADKYRLQVATDGSFSSTVVDEEGITGTSFEISGMNTSSTYYWRVRASNSDGASDWSASRDYTTETTSETSIISAPVQISPDNGTGSASEFPTFEWEPVNGADYYILHANSIEPTEMAVDTQITATSFTPGEALRAETVHDWRVRAVQDGTEGEWSPIWRFTTVADTDILISVPILSSPEEGTTGAVINPLLQWQVAEGGETYRLQLSTSSDYSSVVTDSAGLTATEFQADGLDHSSTYHWRVRASNSDGASAWSASRDFTTEASSEPVILSAPLPISPDNGTGSASEFPTFEWEPVDGADYYILHANSIDPTEMAVDTQITATSFTPGEALRAETVHDWRVRAVKDGTEGEWSPIWSFTTGGGSDFTLNLTGSTGIRMISSPVANITLEDFLSPLWTQGIPGSDAERNDPTIFAWNEEQQSFTVPSSMNEEMQPGKGYLVWVFEDDNPSEPGIQGGFPKKLGINGTENSGPVTIPITVTDADQSSKIDGQEGWNLVGNPYGVPLLVDEIIKAAREVNSQINSNVYVWDPETSDYTSLSEGEGHTISPFQVFWLRYLEEAEGTLALDKSRLSASNSMNKLASFKSPGPNKPSEESGLIKLKLIQDSRINDEFVMEFNEKGRVGSNLHDAYKLTSLKLVNSENPAVELYSVAGNTKEHFSKKHLPESPDKEFQIMLGFSNSSEGELTLEWPEISNIPQKWNVEIKDVRKNKIINLDNVSSYTFNSAKGRDDDRFVLKISPSTTEETQVVDKPQSIHLFQNYPNPFNPSTEIKYTVENKAEVNLTIYNLVGKKVATLVNNSVQDQGTYSLRFNASQLTSGIYIYRIRVGAKTMTRKMTLIK